MNSSEKTEEFISKNVKRFLTKKKNYDYYRIIITEILFDLANKEIFGQESHSKRLKRKIDKFRERENRENILDELRDEFYRIAGTIVSRIKFLKPDFFDRLDSGDLSQDELIEMLENDLREVLNRFSSEHL